MLVQFVLVVNGRCPGHAASSPATTASASASAVAPAGPTSVTATETEFHIALSATTFHPGSYKFVAVNKGSASHNLVISGPGVNQVKTAGLISPGGQESVTVTLQAGTYDIYCGVPGHKAMGMTSTSRSHEACVMGYWATGGQHLASSRGQGCRCAARLS